MTRVSGMDVVFLYGESANWHMHVCGLALLDPSTAPGRFDADAVRELFVERLASAPQFRWRLHDVALGLDQPVFVEDEEFDLDRHFHRAAVPRPGTQAQLAEVVGRLMARKLDRSRPLWEVWLIEGLEHGRVATLTKIHHAIIDGVSGADLAGLIMDTGPVPEPRGPVPHVATDPAPSPIVGALGAVRHALAGPAVTTRYAVQLTRQAAVFGRHLLGGSAAGMPFSTAGSRLNGALTPRREVAFASVPLADVVRIKDAFGVKVNDVVLALVGDALRTWLDRRGELPGRPLVAEVPVSVRSPTARGDVGTRVANSFVSLATDLADPVDRLLAIHRSSRDAKSLQRDLAACKQVDLSDVPPPSLLGAVVRAFAGSGLEARIPPIYSVIVSNVAGPTLDFYIAGARVEAVYPLGPLLYGSGLNVTALTLGDRIHFGIVACPDVVPEPWTISDRIAGALADLDQRRPAPDAPGIRARSRRRGPSGGPGPHP